ncbi:hypothetical protein B4U80_09964 [Leptotrombidium deliense]|uniref:Ras-related protein Rab-14 n=1 Tax=Leptotrombidium deliense TaxID=299467 RepID=A0A443SGZ8_9ACAR|nr:hypothetical protein B4U80_09964 [Leptotrombidium deliense]
MANSGAGGGQGGGSGGPYNYSYIFKYIIIGDMGVGKSCLLHQFTEKKCTYILTFSQSLHTYARNLTNPNTVIYLIGNKSDLESQRDVTYDEAKMFAEENGLMFIEASAKTGENVEEAFLETAKKIYQNIQDGSLDLNAAESGVQHKPASGAPGSQLPHRLGGGDSGANKSDCAC